MFIRALWRLGAIRTANRSLVAGCRSRAADYPRLCGSFALKETELSIPDVAGHALAR